VKIARNTIPRRALPQEVTDTVAHCGMAHEVQREIFRPPADPVWGTLLWPSDAPTAAAVLIGGSGGQEPDYLAGPLAAAGIAALSVAYFARPGLPPSLAHIELRYFERALELLRARLGNPSVPIAVLGQSRGSEAALLCGVHFAGLVASVIATVPANLTLCGYPDGGPAWLLDCDALPWAEEFGPDCDDPAALIAVERINGPVMLVAAGADELWPSAPMAQAISQRLRVHGDRYGHRLLEYPDAGHTLGYLRPDLPAGVLPADLDNSPATQAARADAWPQVLRFLRDLGPSRSLTAT
jgi:dienelactone hydrolase